MDSGAYNRFGILDDDDAPAETAPAVQKAAPTAAKPKPAAAAKKPNVQAGKENKSGTLNKDQTSNKKVVPNAKQTSPAAGGAAQNKSRANVNATGSNSTSTGTGRNVSFRQDNEAREQRNNRRNVRNDNASEFGNAGSHQQQQQQRPFRENRDNRGERDNRDNRGGNFRNRDGHFRAGKREFDRQSGSDKTGVKAIDKRDGAGAHNWGSVKEEIENVNNPTTDVDATLTDKEENEANDTSAETTAAPEEEEVKEMTLDEWKALRQQREKPKYNIRKPGEGEDNAQWKKMIVLNKKKEITADSEEEFEYDPSLYPQRVGRLQRVVDIQFNFKDGRRGNFGGRGGGRGGPRGERGDREGGRFEGGNRGRNRNNNDGERTDSGKSRNFGGERQQKSGANKIDYESQFPTLS